MRLATPPLRSVREWHARNARSGTGKGPCLTSAGLYGKSVEQLDQLAGSLRLVGCQVLALAWVSLEPVELHRAEPAGVPRVGLDQFPVAPADGANTVALEIDLREHGLDPRPSTPK